MIDDGSWSAETRAMNEETKRRRTREDEISRVRAETRRKREIEDYKKNRIGNETYDEFCIRKNREWIDDFRSYLGSMGEY